jgi:hypothetical protein
VNKSSKEKKVSLGFPMATKVEVSYLKHWNNAKQIDLEL